LVGFYKYVAPTALGKPIATLADEGRRREWFWQRRRALDALGAMVFLATD